MPAHKSKSKKPKPKPKPKPKSKSNSGPNSESGRIELIARGLILAGDFILLCRHVRRGYHYLPGGHVEFGEAAAAALERELVEECGLRARARGLVLVTEERFNDGKVDRHEMNLVFHVEHRLGRARSGSGIEPKLGSTPASDGAERDVPPAPIQSREPKIAFDWVNLRQIERLDLRPETIKQWVGAGLAGKDPARLALTWIAGQ